MNRRHDAPEVVGPTGSTRVVAGLLLGVVLGALAGLLRRRPEGPSRP